MMSVTVGQSKTVLKLDESTHTYTLDGRRLIGVMEALSILDDRWKVDEFYLERGRLIHLVTEYYDYDDLIDDTVDERIRPYLNAYGKFWTESGVMHCYIEYPLHHPTFFYAGRIDRISRLNGEQVLIDLKSGAKSKVDALQAAAYWELCRANNIPIKKVFDLYLKDDGNYSLVEVEKPKLLLPVFLACLKITQWREGL